MSDNQWLDRAVQAFEEVERVQFLLYRKEMVLTDAVYVLAFKDEKSKAEYFERTEEIRKKYAEKLSEFERKVLR